MRPRALLGPLRIALVLLGVAVVVGAGQLLLSIPEPPPGSDGFPQGFAFIILVPIITLGFALAAGGLAIRAPADSPGGSLLRFGRRQRQLVLAGFGLLAGSLVVGVAITLLANRIMLAVEVWLVMAMLGLVATAAALGWRLVEGVVAVVRG